MAICKSITVLQNKLQVANSNTTSIIFILLTFLLSLEISFISRIVKLRLSTFFFQNKEHDDND